MKQSANAEVHYDQESASIKVQIPEISIIPSMEEQPYPNRAYQPEPPISISPARWEGVSGNWQDPQSLWQLPSLEVPGSKNCG